MRKIVLVGLGAHARAKYAPLLKKAREAGVVGGIDIIELKSRQTETEEFLAKSALPVGRQIYLDTPGASGFDPEGEKALRDLARPGDGVIVATEARAHRGYVSAAMRAGVDCLVDKPVIVPQTDAGELDPGGYLAGINRVLADGLATGARCTVMAPRRYHGVYRLVAEYAEMVATRVDCPVSFVGIEHHEGVWNTHDELEWRDDHPYKHGYGMLCHSGYHYVDVLHGLLDINARRFGGAGLSLTCHSTSAFDASTNASCRRLVGDPGELLFPVNRVWGESDFVAAGATTDMDGTGQATFAFSMMQNSVSVRNWRTLPAGVYNKNGRFASERIRINIGPFVAIEAQFQKVPTDERCSVDGLERRATVTVWRNSPLLGGAITSRKDFGSTDRISRNADLGAARSALFADWLARRPGRSSLSSHLGTSRLFERLLQQLSIQALTRARQPVAAALSGVPQ